jgi:hypothetical protein
MPEKRNLQSSNKVRVYVSIKRQLNTRLFVTFFIASAERVEATGWVFSRDAIIIFKTTSTRTNDAKASTRPWPMMQTQAHVPSAARKVYVHRRLSARRATRSKVHTTVPKRRLARVRARHARPPERGSNDDAGDGDYRLAKQWQGSEAPSETQINRQSCRACRTLIMHHHTIRRSEREAIKRFSRVA